MRLVWGGIEVCFCRDNRSGQGQAEALRALLAALRGSCGAAAAHGDIEVSACQRGCEDE